jgi:dephospho-CoA kinase
MILGVTGLIGSGKSIVARTFEEEGAILIDCDVIGRDVVENDPALRYQLMLEFGASILTKKKTIDRRELGRLAFSSEQNTDKLNAIVHPPLLAELDHRMAEARRKKRNAVVDAALLVYWGYHKKVDVTILVTATAKNRFARLRATGLTDGEINQRTKSQLSLSHLKKHADIILTNNADRRSVQAKAVKLYRRLIMGERG